MPPVSSRDLAAKVAANREGIDVYFDVARNIDADRWVAPARPGGWSPAQITDHLTRAFDFGTAVIGQTQGVRPLPGPLRWLLGTFWFKPAVRNGKFSGRTKAPRPFDPAPADTDVSDLLGKLRAASERFVAAVEAEIGRGQSTTLHPMFGTIALLDFLDLQVIHVRHHRAQLPQIS